MNMVELFIHTETAEQEKKKVATKDTVLKQLNPSSLTDTFSIMRESIHETLKDVKKMDWLVREIKKK